MSTRTAPPQWNFSAGEVSPLLHRRMDYQRRQSGLAVCRGFLPLRQGGVTRAPGTVFRGYARGNARARLIDFEFAANDAVVLEFTHLRMRVWRYGAQVMASPGVPYEIVTPFTEAMLDTLSWVQSADVIYLAADGTIPVQRLARYALASWTITPFLPDTGPFRTGNADPAVYITASGDAGAVTLTCSGSIFTAGHVGSLMLLRAGGWADVPRWTGNTAVSAGQLMRYDGRVYQLTEGDNTGVNPPQHLEGTEQVQLTPAVKWAYVSDDVGIVRITAVTSPTTAAATVVRRLPRSVVTGGTYLWAEGAWSAVHGYPAAIELFQQRLVAAASPADPRTLWFSAAGDFRDFLPSIEDDGAFAYGIAGEGSVNRILWLRRGRAGLHIGALGEEQSTRMLDTAQTVSPTSMSFGVDSSIGSAPARPLAPRGDPMFISKDRMRLFEIVYSLQADANRALELSLPAEHLGAGKFAEAAFQRAPNRLVWIRREVGDLAVMLYDPDEDVLGWATLPVAGGVVESVVATPAAAGGANVVTLVVRRVIAGQTVRMIEELAETYGLLNGSQPIAEAIHLFASAVFTPGSPTAAFSVPHLAGQQVRAWTDAGDYGPLTVASDGAVVLDAAVTRATIGLFDPTHMAETLPIRAEAQAGDTMGRRKRLYDHGVAVHRTAAGQIATVERGLGKPEIVHKPVDIIPRPVAQDLSVAWTGVAQIPAQSGGAADQAVRFLPVGGAPLTVLALVPTIEELS